MNLEPVIFSSGSRYFDDLQHRYSKHNSGLFILAPSGAGKTFFCTHQPSNDWIDGDELWISSGAHPDLPWWTGGEEVIHRVDQRSDVVTMEAKLQGFWIMGASNFWLQPDAVVIPDWETHVAYIKNREEHHYDGGAKLDALEQVRSHVAVIEKWHTDYGVPKFKSIQDAVNALVNQVE